MGEKRAATREKSRDALLSFACSFKLSASLFCSVRLVFSSTFRKKQTDAPWEDEGPRDAAGFLKKKENTGRGGEEKKNLLSWERANKKCVVREKSEQVDLDIRFRSGIIALSFRTTTMSACPRARRAHRAATAEACTATPRARAPRSGPPTERPPRPPPPPLERLPTATRAPNSPPGPCASRLEASAALPQIGGRIN